MSTAVVSRGWCWSAMCVVCGVCAVLVYDEDDGGCVFSGHAEDVSHHPRPLSQVLLHELAAHNANEARSGVVCHSLRHHRLSEGQHSTAQARRRVSRGVDGHQQWSGALWSV